MPIQDDMQRWPTSLGVKNHNELTGVTPSQHHAHYYRMIWDMLSQASQAVQKRGPNVLMLIPFEVPVTLTVDRCAYVGWTVAAGNVRMGIYRDNGNIPDGGALLAEGGPQVAVASSKNEVPIPATQLTPGVYWLAVLNDDGNCDFINTEINASLGGTLQAHSIAQAFGPLPNPCPATIDEWWAPIGYVRVASVP